ncbi:S-layer homology domain-containing protein [Sporosarcina beigongshangi]|uniref:S-layer homology domain-containing protein n=1 Tax=Sporosarcina beigongshangi TaxID=2782538 RepID=UPI001939BB3E|nr:S-layer homology domain-containing protein [Sporosarcina beigongshangi]
MAYQPKSYKKFVATAATATLVASAIVPVASAADAKAFKDVSSNYKEAVDYLVANDIAQGKTDTTFGTTASITRGDAAVMIAKALKLDTAAAPSAGFKDVNARVAGAVNALVAAKIVSGKTETTFAPDANITRQEMAKIIANAYELEAGTTKNKYSDVNSNWDAYVDALVANEVTLGLTETTFGATQSVTRGQFALFVFRSEGTAPSVATVSAINTTDLKVTLKGNLKDVTIDKNDFEVKVKGEKVDFTVVKVNDKEFTLKLQVGLKNGDEIEVIGASDLTKSVKTTYAEYAITKVEAVSALVADDKAYTLKFKVNGADWTTDALAKADYDIEFVADAAIFGTTSSRSTTGVLSAADLTAFLGADKEKTFKYKVVIKKDNKLVAESDNTEILVVDDATTALDAIKSVNLAVEGAAGAVYHIESLSSNKLVKDEVATIDKLIGTTIDGRYEIDLSALTTNMTLTSSNPAILSVDTATRELTAVKPGTVKVTLKSGKVTKDINITVVTEARKLNSATVSKTNFNLGLSVADSFTATLKDQFGDTFDGDVDNDGTFEAITVTATGGVLSAAGATAGGAAAATSGADGKVAVNFTTAATAATGEIQVKNGNNILARASVKVSGGAAANTKLEATGGTTVDLNPLVDNTSISFKLNNYTAGGAYLGNDSAATLGANLEAQIVDADGNIIADSGALGAATDLVDAAGKITVSREMLIAENSDGATLANGEEGIVENFETGSAEIQLVDATTGAVQYFAKFNIVNTQPKISSATFAKDFEFVLGVNTTGQVVLEDLLTSYQVNTPAGDRAVRFQEFNGELIAYIDSDGDSTIDPFDWTTDVYLGEIEVTGVPAAATVAFADTGSSYLAKDTTVTPTGAAGNKLLFNFYAPGDVNTYVKPLATTTITIK